MSDTLVLVIPVTVLLVALLVATWIPQGRRLLLRRSARAADLAPPSHDCDGVVRRLQQRQSAGLLGLSVGLVVAGMVIPAAQDDGRPSYTVPLLMGAGFVGSAVATAAHAVLLARRAPDDGSPRVARSREVRLTDYVSPFERRSAAALCLLPPALGLLAALLVVAGVLQDPPVQMWLVGTLALVPPALLVLAWAAGTLVLGTRQPASSAEELAWDDALRAQSLRDVLSVPMYAGLMGTVLLGAEVSTNLPDNLAPAATSLLVVGVLVVAAVLLVLTLATRPARYFRHRLWPLEQAGARP